MNCPNCNKWPVSGLFPSFQPLEVGIKKAFRGQFKCKHCGTLLQQSNKAGVPSYQKAYWFYMIAYIILLLGGMLAALYMNSKDVASSTVIIGGLVGYIFLLLAVVDSFVKPRYWKLERVESPASSDSTKVKLTSRGWIIFITFSVVSIALFIGSAELLSGFHLNKLLVTGSAVLYSTVVMAGAIYILTKYSEEQTQTE